MRSIDGKTDNTTAPSDTMDLDSGSTVTNQAAFKAETLHLQRQVEAKTSATVVGELLASRLHTRSPFGRLSLLLIVCSSLPILAKASSSPGELSIKGNLIVDDIFKRTETEITRDGKYNDEIGALIEQNILKYRSSQG